MKTDRSGGGRDEIILGVRLSVESARRALAASLSSDLHGRGYQIEQVPGPTFVGRVHGQPPPQLVLFVCRGHRAPEQVALGDVHARFGGHLHSNAVGLGLVRPDAWQYYEQRYGG